MRLLARATTPPRLTRRQESRHRKAIRTRSVTFPSVDHYKVIPGVSVGGATQKDILEDPATGAWYIAKLGRRNSDLEVMTEFAIYLAGRSLGVPVAEGRIARYNGQLRFLSRYFLDVQKSEELVHGVQLFQELYDDATVRAVLGNQASEQQLFNVQSVKAAFGAHYGPQLEEALFEAFVAMLTHDALLGVQDRHHENWGVVVQRGVATHVRFAPLYDSARGLFCNETEEQLIKRDAWKNGYEWLNRYIQKASPLVGFGGAVPANNRKYLTHGELLVAIYRDYPAVRDRIRLILASYDWASTRALLWTELAGLCSRRRVDLVLACLRRRQRLLQSAINEFSG